MALVMTATQQCDLAIEVFDAKGNPATIDGTPTWSSSEETYVTVEVDDEDPMKAVAFAVGPVTQTPVQINVSVDADLGEGVRQLFGVLDISIVGGEAVSVGISAGTPSEQNEV